MSGSPSAEREQSQQLLGNGAPNGYGGVLTVDDVDYEAGNRVLGAGAGSVNKPTQTSDASSSALDPIDNGIVQFGRIVVFLAMVPQGIFGMLLLDDAFFSQIRSGSEHADFAFRVTLDLLFLAAAIEGKRCIVDFYARDNFANLLKNLRENLIALNDIVHGRSNTPKQDLFFSALNKAQTVVIASVFGGMAHLSWRDGANLMEKMGWQGGAHFARHGWFQGIFGAAALGSNLLAFPLIQLFGVLSLVRLYNLLVRKTDDDRAMRITAEYLREYAQKLYQQQRFADLEALERSVLSGSSTAINEYYSVNNRVIRQTLGNEDKPISSMQRTVTNVAKVVFTVAAIMGLYNFGDMARKTIGVWPPVVGPATIDVTAWTSVISMALMSTGTIPKFVENVSHRLCGRKAPRLLSDRSFGLRMIPVVLFAVLGGAPNAYQAKIADEPAWLLVLAWLASTLLEAPGLYDVYIKSTESAVAKSESTDPNLARLFRVNAKLTELRDDPIEHRLNAAPAA